MKNRKQRNDNEMKNEAMNEVPFMASAVMEELMVADDERTAPDYNGVDDEGGDVAAPVESAVPIVESEVDPLVAQVERDGPDMVYNFAIDTLVADPTRNGRFKERLITDDAVKQLAKTIALEGQLQPGKVLLALDGKRYVAFGTGRYLAIKLLNSTRAIEDQLPFKAYALVESIDDKPKQRVQNAMENIYREDLTPLDKMKIACDLIEKEGLNQKQVAARLGIKPAMVTMYVKLSKLPTDVIELIATGKISATAVYDLTVVMDDPKALEKEVKRLVGEAAGKRVTVAAVNTARGKVKIAKTKGEKGEGKAGRKNGSKQRAAKQILSFIEAEATPATNAKYKDKNLADKLECFAKFVKGGTEETFLKNLAAL